MKTLVRKAKLQTASKHQKESLKSIETLKNLNFVKHGVRMASLCYYVILLLLSADYSNGSLVSINAFLSIKMLMAS